VVCLAIYSLVLEEETGGIVIKTCIGFGEINPLPSSIGEPEEVLVCAVNETLNNVDRQTGTQLCSYGAFSNFCQQWMRYLESSCTVTLIAKTFVTQGIHYFIELEIFCIVFENQF
jgi:hypothetical protein